MRRILAVALLIATSALATEHRRPSRPPADHTIYPRSGLTGSPFAEEPTLDLIKVSVFVSDPAQLAAENGTEPDGTIPVRVWRARDSAGLIGTLCNTQVLSVPQQAGEFQFNVDPTKFYRGDVLYFEHRSGYTIDYAVRSLSGAFLRGGRLGTDSTFHLLSPPWIGKPITCD